jgi:hypothetical protein
MSGGGVGGPADASEVDVSAGETVTFLIDYRAGIPGMITIT